MELYVTVVDILVPSFYLEGHFLFKSNVLHNRFIIELDACHVNLKSCASDVNVVNIDVNKEASQNNRTLW